MLLSSFIYQLKPYIVMPCIVILFTVNKSGGQYAIISSSVYSQTSTLVPQCHDLLPDASNFRMRIRLLTLIKSYQTSPSLL